MITGIYTITNTVDGKMYVGLATDMEDRWSQHKSELRSSKHKSRHLQNAWKKHGEESFKFEVLIECEEQHLYSEEHYWCNILQVHNRQYGYNIQPTGPYGKTRCSEETKQILREKNKGRRLAGPMTDKGRESLRKAMTGRKASQETLRKMSESKKGVIPKISDEVRKQMSVRARSSRHTEEAKRKIKEFNYKPIIVLSEYSKFIEELPSCEKVIEKYEISNTTLHRAISKKKTVRKKGTKDKFFFIDKKDYNPNIVYKWDSEEGKRGKSYKSIPVKVININTKEESVYYSYCAASKVIGVQPKSIMKGVIKGYTVKNMYKIEKY